MDSDFSHDLDEWLNTVIDGYEVKRTIRISPEQTTEVVYKASDADQRIGPFIRKRFAHDTGLGTAYQLILRAQTAGNALAHQPFVYDFSSTGETTDVVMEYLHGITLRERVQQDGPGLPLLESIGPALCDALTELHENLEKPIIHRDVKPSNIMLANGRLLLIDLGIARTFNEEATHDTARYGTPGYAPPEQFGFGQTGVASDVYAIGMTLSYCLTGEDPTSQLRENGFEDPRIPTHVRPILVKATQFDPTARYESARALRDDLVAAVTGTNDLPSNASARKAASLATSKGVPIAIGILWYIIVLGLLGIFLAGAFAAGFIHPSDSLAKSTLSVRTVLYVFYFVVPLSALAYLLLDKRLLRRHPFFARLTWRQELPTLLLATFASFVLGLILYVLLH